MGGCLPVVCLNLQDESFPILVKGWVPRCMSLDFAELFNDVGISKIASESIVTGYYLFFEENFPVPSNRRRRRLQFIGYFEKFTRLLVAIVPVLLLAFWRTVGDAFARAAPSQFLSGGVFDVLPARETGALFEGEHWGEYFIHLLGSGILDGSRDWWQTGEVES